MTSPQQTVRSVCTAELRRLARTGGSRRWMVLAFALAVLAGLGTSLLSRVESAQSILAFTGADIAGVGPFVVMLVLTIAVANFVSREIGEGWVFDAKLLVPGTRDLYLARVASWFVAVLLVSFASGVVGAVAALVVGTPSLRWSFGASLATLVLASTVSGLGVTLVHAGSTILQRGAYIVSVALFLLIILPLVAAVGQVFLPGGLGRVVQAIGTVMVGPLLLRAGAVPEAGNGSWLSTGAAFAGVLVWWSVTNLLAYRRFRRSGFGDA